MIKGLARYATRVAVRRCVAVLVLGGLAWAGVGRSQEPQDTSSCFTDLSSGQCQTRADAHSGAVNAAEARRARSSRPHDQEVILTSENTTTRYVYYRLQEIANGALVQNFTRRYVKGCAADEVWNPVTKTCESPDDCEAGEAGSITFPHNEGGYTCRPAQDGTMCSFVGVLNIDPTPFAGYVQLYAVGGDKCTPEEECLPGYYRDGAFCKKKEICPDGSYAPQGGVCPEKAECPTGMVKGPDGKCRPEQDDCPVGQVKGPDGSCIEKQCPDGYVKTSAGTCAKDEDDDGEPDDGTEHKASGGDHCDAPPTCSGDEIMCLHAKQLWRIDCNTRKAANVQLDNYCQAPPVCNVATGDRCDGVTEASLFLQWRNVCETQRAADLLQAMAEDRGAIPGDPGDPGPGQCPDGTTRSSGDLNCDGQPDWTEEPGDGTDADLGEPGSAEELGIISEGSPIGGDGLDTSGWGWSRSCPAIPTVSVMGAVIEIDASVFCNFMKLSGQLVLIGAALLSLKIMGGGGTV